MTARARDVKAEARLILGMRPEDDFPQVDAAISAAMGIGFKTPHGIARVAGHILQTNGEPLNSKET